MSDVMERLQQFGQGLIDSVVIWAPRVLGGIALILIVLIAAKLIERFVRGLLRRVKLDAGLARIGVSDTLSRVGLQQPASQLIARLVYWLVLFVFVQTAAEVLGLTPISNGIGAFMAYLPNLLAALLIMLAGSLGGQFAGKAVGNAAGNSGIEFASALGGIVSAVILVVAGVMAIGQLQIDTAIVRLVTGCTLAALALAFGLSFGLGTREITRNIIAGYYARKVFEIGRSLQIKGEEGELTAITPTQTLISKDGKTIAVSNSVFLEEVVKQ